MKNKRLYILLALVAVVGLGLLFVLPQNGQSEESDAVKTVDASGEQWIVRCNEGAPEEIKEKRGQCEIFQRLVLTDSNKRLIEFAIGFPSDREDARGIVVLPLGIMLEPGVSMEIDDGQPFKFNVRFCDPRGCYAYVNLNKDVLDMMRKGGKVTISFQTPEPKTLRIEMLLKGFTRKLKEIS